MNRVLGRKKSVPSVEDRVTRLMGDGWRFTLKGSPRHFDDVKRIIEATGNSQVYFGEALAYERGAGIALWRIEARDFSWLPTLYTWWAEMERIEPINFTFNLYIPPEFKYAALDLREHTPAEVEAYIKQHAPKTYAGAIQ